MRDLVMTFKRAAITTKTTGTFLSRQFDCMLYLNNNLIKT
ncbi:hypothetical protein BH11BAC5_BH11BAC5_23460 [soil metagenome]